MKKRSDFSNGKRSRISPSPTKSPGKTRITIRIDADLMDYFLEQADAPEDPQVIKPSSIRLSADILPT
ncbi:MAG TPA: hypothetical protein VHX37_09285 [Acidobacteriaceae bacterium]|jgi:uncharacterized protein (DUF4415 family)|nr:hypothetical protein [Acidobacteriaceae bacterium]